MYQHNIEVRFRDFDSMGHVNNSVFLSYLEMLRINYVQQVFKIKILTPNDFSFILANVTIDYKYPIEVQHIKGEIWVSRIGTSSFEFSYKLYNDKHIFALAKTTQVSYDYKSRTKIPIPTNMKNILESELKNLD
jgi:acyl-CoA thioester hydrolase